MKPSKILVTGVGLGKDLGACSVCNYDLSWLISNLGNLVWIDKILLSSFFRETIDNNSNELASRGTRHLIQQLEVQGLIETYDIKDAIDKTLAEQITRKVYEDIESLVQRRIATKTQDNSFIILGSNEYCPPAIWSYYASVVLSQMMGASCFFDASTRDFIKTKLELYDQDIVPRRNSSVFHRVLMAHLPDPVEYPYYIFSPKGQVRGMQQACRV
jgi:hypothetical protein